MRRVRRLWFNRRKRGAGTNLFSGRTHAGSLFLTNFVGLDIFNSPESVPHRYFGFHAEALIQLHGHIEGIGKVLYILFKGKI